MAIQTIMDESLMARKNAWRPGSHFRMGDTHADMLNCLSHDNAATAIATGKLELRGKHANRSEGKKGRGPAVYLWMQTMREEPQGICEPVQHNGNFIGLTSEASINYILDHFGVSLDDVRDLIGEPGEYESKHVDLYDVLASCSEVVKATAKVA